MRTIDDSSQMGERRALTLLPATQPWYARTATSADERRRALVDEHTRVLARAVGDHLPCELVLRAAAIVSELQRTP